VYISLPFYFQIVESRIRISGKIFKPINFNLILWKGLILKFLSIYRYSIVNNYYYYQNYFLGVSFYCIYYYSLTIEEPWVIEYIWGAYILFAPTKTSYFDLYRLQYIVVEIMEIGLVLIFTNAIKLIYFEIINQTKNKVNHLYLLQFNYVLWEK